MSIIKIYCTGSRFDLAINIHILMCIHNIINNATFRLVRPVNRLFCLLCLAIEDGSSRDSIRQYGQFYEIKHRELLENRLEHDLMVSDITGINRISGRFVEKLLSVLSKYNQDEERRLIFECIGLMVNRAISRQLS
jgi:hypothetical protein